MRRGSICILLLLLTWAVFGQTLAYDFVNYDDRVYVTQNPQVSSGLTLPGIAWAFAHAHARNWHPLTTLSHMLDCQLFGLNASGHHFINVLLHSLAVLLLFHLLREITGTTWRSAFVAALFAIHPLRVESVAWIAERKDVLSGVFFMLTLAAYARYVRTPTLGRYITMSILFACGLMAKPMLVTVPVVLLLLDYWPLGRGPAFAGLRRGRQRSEIRGQIVEKIPLFAMSILSGVATFLIQERSVGSIQQLPFVWRVENAIISYVVYIWQMFWPANLAVFYPHPENHLPVWQIALAFLFLIAITLLVFLFRKARPYLLVGWLWYLSMLAPVIGIVQVGLQGHADRYSYLAHIGLYLAITWLIVELLRDRPAVLATAAIVVIAALNACAWKQTSYWRNSETLWTHALAVTRDNDVAHTNLGLVLMERGQLDDAIAQFETALQIRSGDTHAHYDLSRALIHVDLGQALARKESSGEAIAHFRKAIELQPNYADAYYNLGAVLFERGDVNGAIAEWNKTLSIQPDDADAHTRIANAFLRKGSLHEAVDHYEKAVAAPMPSIFAFNNLAWILATCPDASFRNGTRAVDLAHRAVKMSGRKCRPSFARWRQLMRRRADSTKPSKPLGARAPSKMSILRGRLSRTSIFTGAMFRCAMPL